MSSFKIHEETNTARQPKPLSQDALNKLNALRNVTVRSGLSTTTSTTSTETKTDQSNNSSTVNKGGFAIVPVMNENSY